MAAVVYRLSGAIKSGFVAQCFADREHQQHEQGRGPEVDEQPPASGEPRVDVVVRGPVAAAVTGRVRRPSPRSPVRPTVLRTVDAAG